MLEQEKNWGSELLAVLDFIYLEKQNTQMLQRIEVKKKGADEDLDA
jgi:hypothetical protein